jgi:fatty acid desaturase
LNAFKSNVVPSEEEAMNVNRSIEWRDLLVLSPAEKAWELALSLPWLAGSFLCYQAGCYGLGAFCSFYFFLTGLRQSHGAQHYTLGVPRLVQDGVLFGLSLLMLTSMHAVQVSHLHHHRHCLQDGDAEGATALLPWWKAVLVGPLFPLRLHRSAWQIATPAKRRWILAEVLGIVAVVGAALTLSGLPALQWHAAAMLLGESMTGFFAVWTVHHGCDPTGLHSRTQRGRWVTWLSYSMFFHAEHHLYPAVPTCRLAELAARLDAAMPEICWPSVVPVPQAGRPALSRPS